MCYKCKKGISRPNTRYCDDWWDDTPHGGRKADRKLRKKYEKEMKEKAKREQGLS